MTRPRTPAPAAGALEPARSRVSWGAVVAGTVMALIVWLLIELIMLWLGLGAFDPAVDPQPFEGIGTAAAIGFVLTVAIALFVGGLVTGRLANLVNSTDVLLHGLLTWAVVTLVSVWLAATVLAALLTGALGVVGQGLALVGEGATAVAPAVAQRAEGVIEEQRLLLEDIQQEMEGLWTDPAARREFRAVVTRILHDGDATVAEADRQQLIDVVATSTELSEAEAEERVDAWIEAYEQGQETLAQVEQELRQAAQAAADALGTAALWAVIGLIVGAVIAMLGARVGAPSSRRETYTA